MNKGLTAFFKKANLDKLKTLPTLFYEVFKKNRTGVKKIYESILRRKDCFYPEVMLIPFKIGQPRQALKQIRRLDRKLELGHRRRGYEY